MNPHGTLTLDPATLVFFLAIFSFWMALISFSTAHSVSSNIRGLQEWGKGMLCFGAAFMLYFLRWYSYNFVTVFLANIILLAFPAYMIRAHALFFGTAYPTRLVVAFIIPGVIGAVGSYFFNRTIAFIVIGGSASVAGMVLLACWQVYRNADWRKVRVCWLSMVTMSLIGAALIVRIVVVLLGSPAETLKPQVSTQFVFFAAAALLAVGMSMSFILMAQERQKRELLEIARLDGLTGLYNRKAFFDSAREIDAATPPEAYSVVMLDIDFFKKVNDTYGHAAGDVTLAHFARLIATSVRSCDLVGRYGGEEFCVLLRECDATEAANFCNRLVEQVRTQIVRLPGNKMIRFTVSAGYATRNTSDPQPRQVKELLEMADQALYRAKRNGRNQAMAA